jgi:rhamnosyl/mannosyltransferase
MKILMVITEAPPITSGVARVADELSTRLTGRGHQVDIISSHTTPRLELGEARLSSMPWRGYEQIYRRACDYDILHIHGPAPTFSDAALLYAFSGRRGQRPKLVYTHHCEIAIQGYGPLCDLYNAGHRLASRLADHVVTSTPSYAQLLACSIPAERISTIPWGVGPGPEAELKPAGLNVLYVGQLRPYKGLDVLLRAAGRLPEATINVIGGGHQEQRYHQMAEQAGLHNVHFLGRVSDEEMRRAYAEAHALVLPSLTRAEAFGLVLLEGMAAGCVPVASKLPGLTDVVDTVGATFQPGDDAALAAALRRLMEDPAQTSALGRAARRRAEQFSWDISVAAYERLFHDLSSRPRERATDWFPRAAGQAGLPAQVARFSDWAVTSLFEPALARFTPSRASLLLWLREEERLLVLAHRGLDDALIGARLGTRRSVAGWVAANRLPVLIGPGHTPPPLRAYLRNPDLASSLALPVAYDDRVVAVLNLARERDKPHYTPDDLRELAAWAPRATREPRVLMGQLPPVAA